jgi:hypothetical protein
MRPIRILLAALLLLSSPSYAAVGPLVSASPLAITAGGAWQALFPVNNNRGVLVVQNPCTSTTQGIGTAESLFIAFGTKPTTTAGAYELTNCTIFKFDDSYISHQAIWIEAATTAHAFAAQQSQ